MPDQEDKLPDFLREFDDAKSARRNIYENTLEAMKKRFPMEDDNYRLELNDLHYDGPLEYSLADQKKALLNNRNLRTNLVGTWRLVDKRSGNVLDEKKTSVMQVPYWTDRGTFINNGSEYTVISQSRLRPGVYARRKSNGEYEAQFNIRPGTGRGFHIGLAPETGVMTLQTGQGSMPLYQILKGMGVDDKEIIKAWGADVAKINAQKADPQAWNKLYKRMAGYKAVPTATEADKIQFVRDAVAAYEVDPEVVERTMGLRNVSTVTPQLLLRASQKVLNVSRGDEKPDNRDNPRFSSFYGVEDYFKERVEKNAGRLANTLLYKARRNGNLKSIQRNALNPWVDTIINGSGLAMPGEEANPLSTLEQMSRISKFGLGGIGSKDAVTMEARDVQGDYLGFVDNVQGPESEAIGVDVRASYRTFLGKDNKLYGEFIDNQTGKKAYVDIATASDRLVAFPGQDPKSPYVVAIKDGIPQRVPRDEVRYTVPSYAHIVGSNTNMNPMPTAVQPPRQFYGSKFWSQYLPQAKGEVPLVDTLMPDGKLTWREYYGRKVGTLGAEADGVVTKVTDDEITIKGNDGKTYKRELVKNIPFNRLSGISYFPSVEVGQEVKAGDMIAHSNFTDKKTGAINMGQNMSVAILPNGDSFEDAWCISESAAKRLATDRLYSFDHDTRNGVTIGKNKYISAFPSKFTKEQVETLDENGVVKPGTILHRGDPVVLSLGPKMLSSQDKALGKLSKALRNSYTDRSEIWEHDYEGKVVDTAVTSKGAKVNVTAQPPVRVGDKLSPAFGIKGVVGTILPDDQMPRNAVTNKPYDILMNTMGFLSRVAPGQLMEISLGKVAKATGKQIRIPQLPPPEGWYKWTQAQMKAAGVPETSDVFDPVTGRTMKGIGDGYMYTMAFHHLAEKKASAVGSDGSYTQDEQPAKGGVEGAKKMCFTSNQPIRTLHGEEHIGYIVEKKVRELVWTRFDDGSWGYSPVTNWFVRKGKMSDVLSIQVNYLPQENHNSLKCVTYGRKTMHVTKNHEIYTLSGKTCAGALKPGDFVASYGYVPTDDQMSLLYGSMLGDAAICGIDEISPYYLDQHSDKQSNYVKWKIHQLGTLVGSRKTTGNRSKSGFKGGSGRTSFYTVNRPDITIPLRDVFYNGPDGFVKKTVKNVDLSSLTDVAIVAWFVDDGCVSVRKRGGISGNIATMGFSEDDVDTLSAWLSSRLGVECHRGKYNDIRMSTAACEAMAMIVAKYMRPDDIPSTKKWLISKVKEYAGLYTGVDVDYTLGTIGALVSSVEPYSDGLHGPDDEINLYDITVDRSHKYCASDVLVSNSGMDLWAMLAHNVPDVIKDSQVVRGTRNDQYWRALQLGLPTPEPEEPFIYKKFLNTLRAGGVNVTEKGSITKIMPQTDKDIDQLAQGRVITSSDMVDSDFEPMKGGLFDLGKTGGMGGSQWSMIQLPEPVPNPIMEEPVRRLLGLTTSKMEDILAGREKLDGKTGGQALKDALSKIDVDKRIEESRRGITTLRGQKRDDAVKIYRYLTAMKQQGLKPQDWMVSKVPVLPPAFRPVSKMGDVALVSDMNELYKDIIENAKNFEDLRKDVSDDGLADERLNIYNSVKAAYGLGEPITPENAAKGVKGAIRQVIGSRPKFGMFQNKVLSKAVNGVSRGVITPDKNLDMDQCGVPEVMAWPMYKPYIMRELVRNGYPNVTAIKMIADKTDTARHALEKVMSERPVILDRAPTWHKFNLMAFKPTLTDGSSIKVSPLIVSGFNADFDGDQMNVHVPSSQKAVQQAYERMLPSKNLTSLTDLKSPRHTPSKEQIFGLYALTKGMDTTKPVRVFNSVSEAKQAYARGEIGPNDPIEIRR